MIGHSFSIWPPPMGIILKHHLGSPNPRPLDICIGYITADNSINFPFENLKKRLDD